MLNVTGTVCRCELSKAVGSVQEVVEVLSMVVMMALNLEEGFDSTI